MAAYEQIKKVKLKDPITVGSSAAILYPVTGINAIFAGTSGDAAATYITGTGSGTQIQPQYLAIVNSNTVVDNQYLAFMNNTTGKVIDTYLNFITNDGKIDPSYLPSYVDDVVEVPVVQAPDFAPHPAYSLMIQEGSDGSVKTYTFYEWSDSQAKWVQGGGEQSKIYIADTASGAGDGSIYRCVSGSTTQAVKISENPYIISTDKTNGVWLDLNNSTLTAKAQLATASIPGTVVIDATAISPTKNVALTISGGTLGVSVALAGSTQAGAVFAVGTQADYAARSSAYGDASVVPTAQWTQQLIESSLAGVPLATYDSAGIVQPSSTGHIVVSSGVISVPDATVSTAGVVYLVDAINTAAEGNAGKAVTQAGIVSYIGSALSGYQPALVPGNGITLASNGTISVNKTGDALGFMSSGELFVSSATATKMGAVLITGDSSFITGGTAYVDGKPVAVNGAAVKDYVDYRFNNYNPDLSKATENNSGVVQIRKLVSATSTDSAFLVPNAWDVTSTIAGATAAVLYKVVHGLLVEDGGIALTPDSSSTPHTLGIGVKLDTTSTSPLYLMTETSRLAIRQATTSNLGVMQAGDGLAVSAGGIVYVPMVSDSAGFDVASNSSKAATVAAIVGYVDDAVAQGQRPITAGVGIAISSGATADEIAVRYTGAIIASGSAITVREADTTSAGVVILVSDVESATPAVANQAAHAYAVKSYMEGKLTALTAHSDPIYLVSASDPNSAGSLQIKDAGDGQRGVVTLAPDKDVFGATAYANAVPTASALVDYVTTTLAGYQTTIHSGAATQIVNGSTIDVNYNADQMSLSGGALTISKATTGAAGLMQVGGGLDVTGGTVYVPLVTDSASFDVVGEAGKPPTVGAVVGYVADELADYQTTLHSGAATAIINGNTVDVVYTSSQMGVDTNNKLYISSATTETPGIATFPTGSGLVVVNGFVSAAIAGATVLGAVKIGSGVTVDIDGTISVDTGVSDSATYVSGSAVTDVALGGVRVVSSAGLLLNVGNLYLDSATTQHLGGIQLAAANTALAMNADGKTLAVQYDTTVMSLTDNKLTVKDATTGSGGIVSILTDGSLMTSSTYAGKVPVASAVADFVATSINGARTTVTGGFGINVSGTTANGAINYAENALVTWPITSNGSNIAINLATANISGTVGPAASGTLGAVYVIGAVGSTFSGDYTANTVPTESAVRTALNALPYITYEEVN